MSTEHSLYQKTIIEHSQNPHNAQKLANPTHTAEGYNQICGDDIHLYLEIKDDIITQIGFESESCAICKASASMMSEALLNKTLIEANDLHTKFNAALNNAKENEMLGELNVFTGIKASPSRIKCANLPWFTLIAAIEGKEQTSTEND